MYKLIDLVDLVAVLATYGRVSVFIWTLHWSLLYRLAVSLRLKHLNIIFFNDIFFLILLDIEVKSDAYTHKREFTHKMAARASEF